MNQKPTINGSPHSSPRHVSYGFSPKRHETRQLRKIYTPLRVSIFPRIEADASHGLKIYNLEESADCTEKH